MKNNQMGRKKIYTFCVLVSESKGRFETNYVFKIWIHLYKVRKKEKSQPCFSANVHLGNVSVTLG